MESGIFMIDREYKGRCLTALLFIILYSRLPDHLTPVQMPLHQPYRFF